MEGLATTTAPGAAQLQLGFLDGNTLGMPPGLLGPAYPPQLASQAGPEQQGSLLGSFASISAPLLPTMPAGLRSLHNSVNGLQVLEALAAQPHAQVAQSGVAAGTPMESLPQDLSSSFPVGSLMASAPQQLQFQLVPLQDPAAAAALNAEARPIQGLGSSGVGGIWDVSSLGGLLLAPHNTLALPTLMHSGRSPSLQQEASVLSLQNSGLGQAVAGGALLGGFMTSTLGYQPAAAAVAAVAGGDASGALGPMQPTVGTGTAALEGGGGGGSSSANGAAGLLASHGAAGPVQVLAPTPLDAGTTATLMAAHSSTLAQQLQQHMGQAATLLTSPSTASGTGTQPMPSAPAAAATSPAAKPPSFPDLPTTAAAACSGFRVSQQDTALKGLLSVTAGSVHKRQMGARSVSQPHLAQLVAVGASSSDIAALAAGAGAARRGLGGGMPRMSSLQALVEVAAATGSKQANLGSPTNGAHTGATTRNGNARGEGGAGGSVPDMDSGDHDEVTMHGNDLQHLDENDLKWIKRKQSNRESARRSRLKRQAEVDALTRATAELRSENGTLRGALATAQGLLSKLAHEKAGLISQVRSLGCDVPAALEWQVPLLHIPPTNN